MSAKGEAAWARHIGAERAARLYHPERFRRLATTPVDRLVSTPRRRRRGVDTGAIARVTRTVTRAVTAPILGGFAGLAGVGTRKRRRRR